MIYEPKGLLVKKAEITAENDTQVQIKFYDLEDKVFTRIYTKRRTRWDKWDPQEFLERMSETMSSKIRYKLVRFKSDIVE